ncbi:recombinase family protein [Sulfurovum sp.]|uniref:recombinase family protein n=1 Tax=Sulfurovum sp. TaxID=1969726 RepID=UPI002867EBBA|nr:recombinase family protein [Sulfurovum sp.]
MVYTYVRQAPDFPTLAAQQQNIMTFATQKGLRIDHEVVEYATKNLLIDDREEFEAFLQTMKDNNTVIVASLSILTTRTDELVKVINCMLSHNVNLWIVDVNMLFNRESHMVDIFPLVDELRTDKKEKTQQIGRPKGSKSSSKFDVYHSEVVTLLSEGYSVSAIARELEVSRSSLKDYIESRGIKELVEGAGKQVREAANISQMDNVLLICPFEKEANEQYKKAI